jgi:hypothetical protein
MPLARLQPLATVLGEPHRVQAAGNDEPIPFSRVGNASRIALDHAQVVEGLPSLRLAASQSLRMMRSAVFSTALIFGGLLRRFGAVPFGIGAIREEVQLEVCHRPTVGSGAAARFHSQTPIALADLVIRLFPYTMPQTDPDESKPWRRQSQQPVIAFQHLRPVPATYRKCSAACPGR